MPVQWTLTNELGTMFAKRGGCAFKVTALIVGGGENGDVDLVVYNPKRPDAVLIVEGKALLSVDEINEVASGTEGMQHAQKQLGESVRILNGMTEVQKQAIFKFVPWQSPKALHGMVVAQDAEPNNTCDHTQFSGVSLATAKRRVPDRHFANLQGFWATCKNRPWLTPLQNGKHIL